MFTFKSKCGTKFVTFQTKEEMVAFNEEIESVVVLANTCPGVKGVTLVVEYDSTEDEESWNHPKNQQDTPF